MITERRAIQMLKKSSFSLLITAAACFIVGIVLIAVCVFAPSEGENSGTPDNTGTIGDSGNVPEAQSVTGGKSPTEPETPDNTGTNAPDLPGADSESDGEKSAVPDPVTDSGQEAPVPPVGGETNTSETSGESSSSTVQSTDSLLMLVNVDNPLPDDFAVGVLETVQGNYSLDIRAASYARQMIDDAAAGGIELQICSSYRSKELQQTLFDNKYNEYLNQGYGEDEAYEKTAKIIAIPGTSEHHTGLAMDIVTPSYQTLDEGYADTDAAKWLAANAYKYGFILRYPEDKQDITKITFEPWHYRFVGVENAEKIKNSGLCLEEYVATLS